MAVNDHVIDLAWTYGPDMATERTGIGETDVFTESRSAADRAQAATGRVVRHPAPDRVR